MGTQNKVYGAQEKKDNRNTMKVKQRRETNLNTVSVQLQ